MEKKESFLRDSLRNGKFVLTAIGALLGIVLLLYGGFGGKTDTQSAEPDEQAQQKRLAVYGEALEAQVAELCTRVTGIGDVRVSISFERGFSAVYAMEGDNYVKIGSGSAQRPLYLYESPPKVGGVGVVLSGVGSESLRRELTALIAAALDVGANKIYITWMQN